MGVPDEAVRHEVVAQQLGVVLRRRRGPGAAVARDAEDVRRPLEQVDHRHQGQLRRGRVAAGVGDPPRLEELLTARLGQPVGPAVVEAVVRRQVDHQGVRRVAVDRLDPRLGRGVRQREHPHADLRVARHVGRLGVAEDEPVGSAGDDVAHRPTRRGPRGDVGQLEVRVLGEQLDQLGAGEAAGAHQGDSGRGRGRRQGRAPGGRVGAVVRRAGRRGRRATPASRRRARGPAAPRRSRRGHTRRRPTGGRGGCRRRARSTRG